MVSVDEVWQHVEKLSGEVIYTPARGCAVRVGEVEEERIYVYPEATGKRWFVWREHIEAIWRHLLLHGEVQQAALPAIMPSMGKGGTSSYNAAILASLPGVCVVKGRATKFVLEQKELGSEE